MAHCYSLVVRLDTGSFCLPECIYLPIFAYNRSLYARLMPLYVCCTLGVVFFVAIGGMLVAIGGIFH